MELTKERLTQIIRAIDSEAYDEAEIMGWFNSDDIIAMARQLLASMEREPVAYMIGGYYLMHAHDPKVDNYASVVPLYTAPPAPVVPDDVDTLRRDANRYRFLRDKDAFGNEDEHGLASWDDLAELESKEFDTAVDSRMMNSDVPMYETKQVHGLADAEVYAELYRLRAEARGPDGFETWKEAAIAERKARIEHERLVGSCVLDIDYLGAMAAFHSDEWHKMGSITGYMHGWNACRAAMLQNKPQNTAPRCSIQTAPVLDSLPKNDESRCNINQGKAEPVSHPYTLRDGLAAIRNLGPIDAEKIQAGRDALNEPTCWCLTCRPVTMNDARFVMCPECGNKRCPHANDHRNACTGSNEPGQEGSAYPAAPQQEGE